MKNIPTFLILVLMLFAFTTTAQAQIVHPDSLKSWQDSTDHQESYVDSDNNRVNNFAFQIDRSSLVYEDDLLTNVIVGTEETPQYQVAVNTYPNPVQDHLFIELNQIPIAESWQVMIYDQLGRIVATKSLYETNTSIDLTHLPPATYFLYIGGEKGIIKTEKLLVY